MDSKISACVAGMTDANAHFTFKVAAQVLCLLIAGNASAARDVTYFYTDAQGTVLATADSAGIITSTNDRAPYGSIVSGAASPGPGFTGHVTDTESSLIYMQARYYDVATSRFLSVDPVRRFGGTWLDVARYSYANSNPYAYQDPDGRVAIVTAMKDNSYSVVFPVTFSGAGATSENIATAKSHVAAMSGTYSVNGKATSVTFSVTNVSTKLFGGTPRAARNEVRLTDGPTSRDDGRSFAEVSGQKAEINVQDRFVEGGTVPHEFAHLGGNEDTYNQATQQPDPSKGDGIMNRVPGIIDSATVETIINSKDNVQRVEK